MNAKKSKTVRECNSNAMVEATKVAVLKLRAERGCICPLSVPGKDCACGCPGVKK